MPRKALRGALNVQDNIGRRTLLWAAVLVILSLSLIFYVLYARRENRVDRLYAEAAGIVPYFHGTDGAETAVRELAEYKGSRETAMLLNIALGRTPLVLNEVQAKAISCLSNRADPAVGLNLSRLLQPQVPVTLRAAAAKAVLEQGSSSKIGRAHV